MSRHGSTTISQSQPKHCACHNEPMDWRPGRQRFECSVRRRARQRRYMAANYEAKHYAAVRHALGRRIARKRALIETLEKQLAQEVSR